MHGDDRDLGTKPVDATQAADLVRRAIREIDATADADFLLTDLLCAAWPSPKGQRQ